MRDGIITLIVIKSLVFITAKDGIKSPVRYIIFHVKGADYQKVLKGW